MIRKQEVNRASNIANDYYNDCTTKASKTIDEGKGKASKDIDDVKFQSNQALDKASKTHDASKDNTKHVRILIFFLFKNI